MMENEENTIELKTTKQLKKQDVENLEIISDEAFSDIVDSIILNDYKAIPNNIRLPNLNEQLTKKLGLEKNSVFIIKKRATHIRPDKKGNHGQAFSVEEYRAIPSVMRNATFAIVDNRLKNFQIVFNDELNSQKINKLVFNKDELGNYLVTLGKVSRYYGLSEKFHKVVGVGVAPTISRLRQVEGNESATRLRPSPTTKHSIQQKNSLSSKKNQSFIQENNNQNKIFTNKETTMENKKLNQNTTENGGFTMFDTNENIKLAQEPYNNDGEFTLENFNQMKKAISDETRKNITDEFGTVDYRGDKLSFSIVHTDNAEKQFVVSGAGAEYSCTITPNHLDLQDGYESFVQFACDKINDTLGIGFSIDDEEYLERLSKVFDENMSMYAERITRAESTAQIFYEGSVQKENGYSFKEYAAGQMAIDFILDKFPEINKIEEEGDGIGFELDEIGTKIAAGEITKENLQKEIEKILINNKEKSMEEFALLPSLNDRFRWLAEGANEMSAEKYGDAEKTLEKALEGLTDSELATLMSMKDDDGNTAAEIWENEFSYLQNTNDSEGIENDNSVPIALEKFRIAQKKANEISLEMLDSSIKHEAKPKILREHTKNSEGYETWYEYDENGNITYSRNSKGAESWSEYEYVSEQTIKEETPEIIETKNKRSTTNFVLEKLKAAGIEVITDKSEFDRILANTERLQKMVRNSIKKDGIQPIIKDSVKPSVQAEAEKNIPATPPRNIVSQQENLSSGKIQFMRSTPSFTHSYDRQIVWDMNKQNVFNNATARLITRIPKKYIDDGVKTLIRVTDNTNPKYHLDIGIYEDNSVLELENYGISQNSIQGVPSLYDVIHKYLPENHPEAFIQNNTIYGFAYNDKIYLNPDVMTSEAAVHEYTHLWDAYTQRTNPGLWQKGKDILSKTHLWNEVKNDPNYADIADDDDLILSECHSRICGKIAGQVLERIAKENDGDIKDAVINWDKETWQYLYKEFGDDTLLLTDFIKQPIEDLMKEKKILREMEKMTPEKTQIEQSILLNYITNYEPKKLDNLMQSYQENKAQINDLSEVVRYAMTADDDLIIDAVFSHLSLEEIKSNFEINWDKDMKSYWNQKIAADTENGYEEISDYGLLKVFEYAKKAGAAIGEVTEEFKNIKVTPVIKEMIDTPKLLAAELLNEMEEWNPKFASQVTTEQAQIILKYLGHEDYKIYKNYDNQLCIYDNSEDFTGEGQVEGAKGIIDFSKEMITKAEELGYHNYDETDIQTLEPLLAYSKERDDIHSKMRAAMDKNYKNKIEPNKAKIFINYDKKEITQIYYNGDSPDGGHFVRLVNSFEQLADVLENKPIEDFDMELEGIADSYPIHTKNEDPLGFKDDLTYFEIGGVNNEGEYEHDFAIEYDFTDNDAKRNAAIEIAGKIAEEFAGRNFGEVGYFNSIEDAIKGDTRKLESLEFDERFGRIHRIYTGVASQYDMDRTDDVFSEMRWDGKEFSYEIYPKDETFKNFTGETIVEFCESHNIPSDLMANKIEVSIKDNDVAANFEVYSEGQLIFEQDITDELFFESGSAYTPAMLKEFHENVLPKLQKEEIMARNTNSVVQGQTQQTPEFLAETLQETFNEKEKTVEKMKENYPNLSFSDDFTNKSTAIYENLLTELNEVATDFEAEIRINGIKEYMPLGGDAQKKHILVEYECDGVSEDALFNNIAERKIHSDDGQLELDVNPITPEKSGTIEEYLEKLKNWKEEQEKTKNQMEKTMEKTTSKEKNNKIDNIKEYTKKLIENGAVVIYASKTASVQARIGSPGERINTVLKDGHGETKNIVQIDENGNPDWIIKNPNGEEYVITNKKFQETYIANPKKEGEYFSNGEIRPLIQLNEDITFNTSWGEEMNIRNGGFLVIKDMDDIYGIAEDEFKQTYKIIENERGVIKTNSMEQEKTKTTEQIVTEHLINLVKENGGNIRFVDDEEIQKIAKQYERVQLMVDNKNRLEELKKSIDETKEQISEQEKISDSISQDESKIADFSFENFVKNVNGYADFIPVNNAINSGMVIKYVDRTGFEDSFKIKLADLKYQAQKGRLRNLELYLAKRNDGHLMLGYTDITVADGQKSYWDLYDLTANELTGWANTYGYEKHLELLEEVKSLCATKDFIPEISESLQIQLEAMEAKEKSMLQNYIKENLERKENIGNKAELIREQEKQEARKIVSEWLYEAEENADKIWEKDFDQVKEVFKDNDERKPIGIIPNEAMKVFNGISDYKLYADKSYIANHYINRHYDNRLFENIQNVLDNYDNIYFDNDQKSIGFVKKYGALADCVFMKPVDGKIVLFASTYNQPEYRIHSNRYKKITPERNQGQKKITGVRHAPSTIEQGLSEAAAGISTLSEKSLEGSTPLSQNPNDKSQGNTAVAISDVNDSYNISQNSDLSSELPKIQFIIQDKNESAFKVERESGTGGVIITHIASGKDVYLQSGDDANSFLNNYEEGKLKDSEIMEYFSDEDRKFFSNIQFIENENIKNISEIILNELSNPPAEFKESIDKFIVNEILDNDYEFNIFINKLFEKNIITQEQFDNWNNPEIEEDLAEKIAVDLVASACGGKVEGYSDRQMEAFGLFDQEWNHLDCDAEGFNAEQEEIADELVDEYVREVSNIKKREGFRGYIEEEISHSTSDVKKDYLKSFTRLQQIHSLKDVYGKMSGIYNHPFSSTKEQNNFIHYINQSYGTKIPAELSWLHEKAQFMKNENTKNLSEIILNELSNPPAAFKESIDKFIANEIFDDDYESAIFYNKLKEKNVITQKQFDNWNRTSNFEKLYSCIEEEISHTTSDVKRDYLEIFTELQVIHSPEEVLEKMEGIHNYIFSTDKEKEHFIAYINHNYGTKIPHSLDIQFMKASSFTKDDYEKELNKDLQEIYSYDDLFEKFEYLIERDFDEEKITADMLSENIQNGTMASLLRKYDETLFNVGYEERYNEIESLKEAQFMKSIPFAKLNIGEVNEVQIAEAKEIGLDLTGYSHEITNEFIAHVIKQHGNAITEKARGQIAITENDLKSIGDVISSPDKVVYGTTYKEYSGGNFIDRERIVYAKNMPDGTSLYFEEVLSGNKKKSLRGTTFFKRFEKVSNEKLRKIIKGTNYKANVDNIKIKARGGAAISPLNRQPNVGAAAISASSEPNSSIADFVDKSIQDYTEAKKINAQNMIGSTIYGLQVGNEVILNKDRVTPEVIMHEFAGHQMDKFLLKNNPALVKDGIDIFKQTYLWNEVKNDSNYSKQFNNYDTTVDGNSFSEQEYYIFSECHSRVIGKFANEVLMRIAEENGGDIKNAVIDWDKEAKEYVLKQFGLGIAENIPDFAQKFFADPMKALWNKEVLKEFEVSNNQKVMPKSYYYAVQVPQKEQTNIYFEEELENNGISILSDGDNNKYASSHYNKPFDKNTSQEDNFFDSVKSRLWELYKNLDISGFKYEWENPKEDFENIINSDFAKLNGEKYSSQEIEKWESLVKNYYTEKKRTSTMLHEAMRQIAELQTGKEYELYPMYAARQGKVADFLIPKKYANKDYINYLDASYWDIGEQWIVSKSIKPLTRDEIYDAYRFGDNSFNYESHYIVSSPNISNLCKSVGCSENELIMYPDFSGGPFVIGVERSNQIFYTSNMANNFEQAQEDYNKYKWSNIVQNMENEIQKMEDNKSYSRFFSYQPFGYEGSLVSVEVDKRKGLPAVDIVGIRDDAVKETRERIKSAITNSGFEFPLERVLISLSPADLRKEGSRYELPIALGVLDKAEKDTFAMGSLDLAGTLENTEDVRNGVLNAIDEGIKNFIIPEVNKNEIMNINFPDDCKIKVVNNLKEAIEKEYTNAKEYILSESKNLQKEKTQTINGIEFPNLENLTSNSKEKEITANSAAIRAVTIAMAGNHNLLMYGSQESGKSKLGEKLRFLQPCLTEEEKTSVDRIRSLSYYDESIGSSEKPFRMPHQTATIEGMYGGGINCKPGEITLAHNGTLFLDGASEFRTSILQMLRVPLENNAITLVRAGRSTVFPAKFQLVMATEPGPDGVYGEKNKISIASSESVNTYWKKVSNPLIERIELKTHVDKESKYVQTVSVEKLREQIANAIKIQRERGISNAELKNSPIQFEQFCVEKLTPEAKDFLSQAESKTVMNYPKRFNENSLVVARTIADLDGRDIIEKKDLQEAILFVDFDPVKIPEKNQEFEKFEEISQKNQLTKSDRFEEIKRKSITVSGKKHFDMAKEIDALKQKSSNVTKNLSSYEDSRTL